MRFRTFGDPFSACADIFGRTKNRFYPMRATLDHLNFDVIKFHRHLRDNRESKVYLRSISTVGRRSSALSKLGQRRQVVLPKNICDAVGLQEGDFVEVDTAHGVVLLKPKRLVDADDVLTTEEEAIVRKGENQIRRGQSVTLEQLEHGLDRRPRKRRRQNA